jgi:hypothetical protein
MRSQIHNVAVIGMGGIGSHLMDHINQLSGVGEFEDWTFTIFDDDTIEPKNLQYQKFADAQMGMYKVDAVYENCMDIKQLTAENKRVTPDELTKIFDVVIICVDSGKWRREFFEKHAVNSDMYWIDLRSEGRTIASFTKHKKNTKDGMLKTIESAQEENGSCQLAYELEQGIIQAGNRIIALVGVQYLLNFHHGDMSAPSFNQRF